MKIVKQLVVAFAFVVSGLSSQADELQKPALGGYCPVAYIAVGKAIEGKEEFSVEHAGKTYLFVNGDAAIAFKESPSKFLPAYDGWCAYGMSLGKKFESDPKVFKVVEGRLFLNKSPEVAVLFEKGIEGHVEKADAEWKKMEKMEKMEKMK